MGYTEQVQKYFEFRDKWSYDRMKSIDLDQYTNSDDDSFIYDIEFPLRELGSIKGGSAFKFGVYKRADDTEKEDNKQYKYSKDYAWYKKYGDSYQEAFERVKLLVLDVIEKAMSGNIEAIDGIDLGDAYKWKIAYHYQNLEQLPLVPIFTKSALVEYLLRHSTCDPNMSMSQLFRELKKLDNYVTIEDTLERKDVIWNEYNRANLQEEYDYIESRTDWDEDRRTNATSNLGQIEYDLHAHKVICHYRHNPLEDSFEKFLISIGATQICRNKGFTDFQFEYKNEKYICELKPTDDDNQRKYAIRGAIGQILHYAYNKDFNYKIIVFQGEPNEDCEKFLDYLRKEHGIYYMYEVKKGKFEGNI